MSRNGLSTPLPPTIANILQNLSTRPNVQSTLVLSRSDGSVIYATGNLSQIGQSKDLERPNASGSTLEATSQDQSIRGVNSQSPSSETEQVTAEVNRELTPAETVALSIFAFVQSAAILGRAVGRVHNDEERRDATRSSLFANNTEAAGEVQTPEDTDSETPKDDQAQLLRMRTKKHEIIIYPDTSFLCCVVQTVGKLANGMA